jgi:hypothetical protein
MSDPEQVEGEQSEKPVLSDREKLEQEKIGLAKKLGIWDKFEPVDNFRETPDYARIQEINAKLLFLVY